MNESANANFLYQVFEGGGRSSSHVLKPKHTTYSYLLFGENRGHFGKMRLKMTFALTLLTRSNLV